jgi:hypothetical protein
MLVSLDVVGQGRDSAHVYVFSADRKVLLIKVAPGAKRFTPSYNDVQKADSLLVKYLGGSKELNEISDKYPNYFRQYVGVEKLGLKGVYIKAFCRKPDFFTTDAFYPIGGGKCYFGTLINLGTSKVEDFSYNAPK